MAKFTLDAAQHERLINAMEQYQGNAGEQ